MSDILEMIIKSKCKTIGNVSEKEIQLAQEELKFTFDNQYKLFLENFGAIACGSNEIFGLGIKGYMNVITATLEARKLHKDSLNEYIVIQDYGIGDILISIDCNGNIYESRNNNNTKIYSSFNEFLEKEII